MVRNNPERPIQALLAIFSLMLLLAVVTAFFMDGREVKAKQPQDSAALVNSTN